MDTRGFLYRLYWKAERVILPGFRPAEKLYADTLKSYINPGIRWLDVGGGHQILGSWRFAEEAELVQRSKVVVGLDLELEALKKHRTVVLRVQGNLDSLPFRDSFFDVVTANMVVEHLERPDAQFRQIWRVLGTGGYFVFHTPNGLSYSTIISRLLPRRLKHGLVWWLEARAGEEVFDTYYRANTRTAIRELANLVGFQIVQIETSNASASLALVPPLAVLELLLIRVLATDWLRAFRPNIIAILRKP